MAARVYRERPSFVKLASVKHELYHPLLPTLRKMDMDDVARRLPDEHSRTSTPCNRGEYILLDTRYELSLAVLAAMVSV